MKTRRETKIFKYCQARCRRRILTALTASLTECLLAMSPLLMSVNPVRAEEGLFLPEQITTPFDKQRALKSIVRIKAHIYFSITVYTNPRDAAAARAKAEKIFLPEGITIWPMVLDPSFLDRLRDDAGLRLLPAFYEVFQAFQKKTSFPNQKFVPLEGAATGFFISPDGYFLTSYHVVREEIEAAGRTEGGDEPLLCRYVSFEIPMVENGQIVGYRPLENVQLIRNLSAEQAKAGLDGVLLKADIESPAYLELNLNEPTVDEPVWALGFPIRTRRDQQRRAALGYPDADGSLRISLGKILERIDSNLFTSTVDGFSGSRGGPTVDRDGKVIGLIRGIYPQKEAHRRAVVFAGGMRQADVLAVGKALELDSLLGGSSQ